MIQGFKAFSEARLSNAQDKVMEGYKTRFGLEPSEASDLHMFFSPMRVPKGLRREEVRVVLLLYPLRDAHRQKRIDKLEKLPGIGLPRFEPMLEAETLPSELTPRGRMTRRGFWTGVQKLLVQMATE